MIALLVLLTTHFVGDFMCQNDAMATRKSNDWRWLLLHVWIYTLVLMPSVAALSAMVGRPNQLVPFLVITFGLHFLVDAITSRLTSKFWFFEPRPGIWEQASYCVPKHGESIVNPWVYVPERRHNFFVMIGLDQLLHIWSLALAWRWCFGGW